jgi:NAD(P)-dependent dehydrogenase (short-subunit alcohol dehydrogenase family)
MAKAALNQQTKTIAQAFKGYGNKIIFITLNPGYIATKLTGWKGEDDMETSVKGMVDIIERVEQSDSGLFFDHSGAKLEF